MKKPLLILFTLILFLPLFASCVKEFPEPIFDPDSVTGESRKLILEEEDGGVTYRVYNDNTSEIVAFDSEKLESSSLVLPDKYDIGTVIAIADGVFSGAVLSSVTLPASLETIGERAFRKSTLSSITLPDTVTEIGKECFDNCLNLEEITFGSGLETVPVSAFFGCEKLKEITLPDGIKTIEEEAFASLSSLEKISLPSTLEKIGAYAFWNTGTDDLVFSVPASVKSIGKDAFRETQWLKGRTEEFVTVGNSVLIAYRGGASSVTLPESIRYLSNAFDRTPVTSLTLNETLEGICENAFEESAVEEIAYSGADENILAQIGTAMLK